MRIQYVQKKVAMILLTLFVLTQVCSPVINIAYAGHPKVNTPKLEIETEVETPTEVEIPTYEHTPENNQAPQVQNTPNVIGETKDKGMFDLLSTKGYKVAKLVAYDLLSSSWSWKTEFGVYIDDIIGSITMSDYARDKQNSLGSASYGLFANIVRGTLGVNASDQTQAALDIWASGDKVYEVSGFINWSNIDNIRFLVDDIGNATMFSDDAITSILSLVKQPTAPLSGFSKFLGWFGVVISGFEAIYNIVMAFGAEDGSEEQATYVLNYIAAVGGLLGSAAVLLSVAFPPVALALAIIGGVLFIFGTLGKLFVSNSTFRAFVTYPVVFTKRIFRMIGRNTSLMIRRVAQAGVAIGSKLRSIFNRG
ncbi:hypothetical protein [Mechercharimyces sp. CAU 1602]|uniref:hypothetical protein n=1 Tax=Mechercharimyces sp. CAU 1602 TaxID=2973933 RepID=UPI002162DB4B|nr:hypothetical protein [Mechercharimyces sp. CAU 1602]MCS1352454.1 hypothetical protein [Mechercharimyces sp. CAU 1602]